MDSVPLFIQQHLPTILEHKYLIFFILASLEGFNTLLAAGFLLSIGTFAIIPTFFIGLAAEILNSYFWYTVGYFGGAKTIDFFVRTSPKKKLLIERIRTYLDQYTGRVLLIMKLTFSLTIVTLLLTGSLKYNFKKFSFYNFVGSIGWLVITLSLGYFLGESYKLYVDYFKHLSYIIAFFVLAVLFVLLLEHFGNEIVSRALALLGRIRATGEQVRKGIDTILNSPDDTNPKV